MGEAELSESLEMSHKMEKLKILQLNTNKSLNKMTAPLLRLTNIAYQEYRGHGDHTTHQFKGMLFELAYKNGNETRPCFYVNKRSPRSHWDVQFLGKKTKPERRSKRHKPLICISKKNQRGKSGATEQEIPSLGIGCGSRRYINLIQMKGSPKGLKSANSFQK